LNTTETNINSPEFIKLLKEDGAKAFELLYKLYYQRLFHLAKNYIGNEEDAKEIIQELFLKLWNRRDLLNKINNSYLFTLTKNACLDYLKSKKIKIEYSKNYYDKQLSDPISFIENEVASKLLEKELDIKIKESIAMLPEKCRVVFMKSRFEGMKNKEIAEDMCISKRTVDTHIHLALRHMRLQLKEYLTLFL
tara:strand:+ start:5036 stop:5614 length:579 start_codon:yes stop_codon:yes gene_type:complete